MTLEQGTGEPAVVSENPLPDSIPPVIPTQPEVGEMSSTGVSAPKETAETSVPVTTEAAPLDTKEMEDPVSAVASRLFMGHWDRATAEALAGFQEAVRQTRKEATADQQDLVHKCETLGSELSQQKEENARLREELRQAQAQVTAMETSSGEAQRNLKATQRQNEYLRVRYQSLEQKLEGWDESFVYVSGFSLQDWDGRRRSLKRALNNRPDSDDE